MTRLVIIDVWITTIRPVQLDAIDSQKQNSRDPAPIFRSLYIRAAAASSSSSSSRFDHFLPAAKQRRSTTGKFHLLLPHQVAKEGLQNAFSHLFMDSI